MINPPFKIFVSVPLDYTLSPEQRSVKHKVLEMLRTDGFEIELMGEFGMAYTQEKIWNHERVERIARCCQGFVAIGFPRWYDAVFFRDGQRNQPMGYPMNLATEFSHSEGALAFAHHLPMLLLIEDGVAERGILQSTNTLVGIGQGSTDVDLMNNQNFLKAYAVWKKKVLNRYHVFFGYSGGAADPAKLIAKFLRSKGVRVRDWKDFETTGTILEQIKQADETCLGGIFLFTGDDTQTSTTGSIIQVPRDNVIFEAGYFMNSKEDTRVQIILEKGTKILADLGGQIYLTLDSRTSIASIKKGLLDFINDRLSNLD
jgi:hypothetical protein